MERESAKIVVRKGKYYCQCVKMRRYYFDMQEIVRGSGPSYWCLTGMLCVGRWVGRLLLNRYFRWPVECKVPPA
ncbi:hypothetical protein RvY_18176 [Ramazzottius varieornatus]|uniref:Uncharacterized protein n=1 Tax=Ramazzottius varieornatus TaxID=947166 RepID=A0A1D1WA03_RAMVA|nr:hypothetical protein RvY_18176 [Ramazzottius varieornatus]